MKKLTFNVRYLMLLGTALLALSCAQGFDSDETFDAGVTNTQLESPALDLSCFSTISNADGSESVMLTWKVVRGAGGYAVRVADVNDPANPVVLVDEPNLDACTVTFPKSEDTDYAVSVKALGNEKLNNKEALAASEYPYTTWAPMQTIPSGADLATAIQLVEPDDADLGQGFALVAGGQYTLSAPVDFGTYNITIKGDETNPPTIAVSADNSKAVFITQAGLKIKNINFDCSGSSVRTLIALSDTPDESVSIEALGYKADGADRSEGWVVVKPIILDGCMVKNLPGSLVYCQKKPWAITDLRITNDIIQLNNSGGSTFLDLSDANPNNALIKELTISNSTIYNLVKNSSAYFIRYANASNARPDRMYGTSRNSSVHRIENCTLAKTFSNKDFGNNILNNGVYTQIVSNTIFYDVFRLYQYLQNNNKRYTTNNTIWGVDGGAPNGNDTGGRKDNDGNPYATEEDPGFTEPFAELDLTKPNGGVNFKASGSLSSTIGDPRWR